MLSYIMKRNIFFIFLFALMSNTSFAQDTEEVSKSKTIEFLNSAGTLLKKEFYELPDVKGIKNEVLIIIDVLSGVKYGCMRLTTKYKNGVSIPDEYIGTLDYEELDACVKSLTYINEELLPTLPDCYTEVEYKTLDNLKIGAYYTSEWKAYVYTKGYTRRSAEFLNSKHIESLISVMEQAKDMIREKIQ